MPIETTNMIKWSYDTTINIGGYSMNYHHLAISEHECILVMHHSTESITKISEVLGRNKSTVSLP